jgi:hypothetical protein
VVADDGASLSIHFYGTPAGGALKDLQDWSYDPIASWGAVNQSIDQDYVTNAILLAPSASYNYKIEVDAITSSESHGDNTSLTATSNMANTLSITGLSVFDQSNNPLPLSYLTSSDGMDYSGVPEPGTLGLLAVPAAALLLRARRRRQRV